MIKTNFWNEEKRAHYFLIIISLIVFLYLVKECFVFSANYDIEYWRGIDDADFQHIMRSNFSHLIPYYPNIAAYGWLFWASNAVFSYPGYWLHLYGYDQLLIMSPRLLSLVLSFSGLYFFYKIIRFYCNKPWICVAITLCLLSYPAFGFYATYFGTAAHLFFYSLLTLYFLLCKDITLWANQKKLVIAFAACGAIKLTGFFILPVVALVFLDKNIATKKLTLSLILKLTVIFFLILVFLINPRLYLSLFHTHYLTEYLSVMKAYIGKAAGGMPPAGESWFERFSDGLVITILARPIYFLCLGLLVIYAFLQIKKQREFLYIVLTYILVSVYLIVAMHESTSYVCLYAYSINWLPLLGLLIFAKIPYGSLMSFLILIFNIYFNQVNILSLNAPSNLSVAYNASSYREKQLASSIHLQKTMQLAIANAHGKSGNEKIRILVLHPGPIAFSTFDSKYDVIYRFENGMTNVQDHFDYIILPQDSSLLSSQPQFETASVFFENQQVIQKLVQQHIFHGAKCFVIYQQANVKLFKCAL